MGKDIFISYSRKDTAVADRICEALDKAGISYFIDRKGIAGGMEFPEILAQAIVDCKIFLFLASRNSYQSNYTSNEITFAFNRKRKMLPYIIDRSELPLALEFTFSCINWRTIEEHPIETVLVNDLKALLGYPASSATEKTSFSVILKSAGHAKLGVVKCVKELTGLGLKDSKELVDNAPSTISRGLSKAEAEIIATTLKKAGAVVEIKKTLPGNSVSASQKTSFTVILKSAGHAKLGVIKCVKELTGLGLKDSKELVDNAPSTIRRGLSKSEAEIIATTLKKAGAEVIII